MQSASGVLPLPLSDSVIRTSYEIEGHPVAKAEEPLAHMRIVSTDYFSVMRIPLVKGRFFTEADRTDSQPVILINKALAERSFPGEDPIGKHIKPGLSISGPSKMHEIVGIVGDVKHRALNRPDDPEAYMAEEQTGIGFMSGVVRTDAPTASLVPAIREIVASLDKDIPRIRHQNDGRLRGRLGGATAAQFHSPWNFRRARAGAGNGRHLWRDVLQRRAAHQ